MLPRKTPASKSPETFLSRTTLNEARKHREEFSRDKDGLHWLAIDNFLTDSAFEYLADAFPLEAGQVEVAYNRATERRKFQTHPLNVASGELQSLLEDAAKGTLRDWVAEVTQNPRIWLDETLPGAGLHETRTGGALGMHIDNLHLGSSGAIRRYNLIIYCSRTWDSAWGGDLFIGPRAGWRRRGDHRRPEFARIEPYPNRALLFETSATSLHGHPEPLACPAHESRRSLSLWFYDNEFNAPVQRTTFVEDPPLRRATDWLYNHGIGELAVKIKHRNRK